MCEKREKERVGDMFNDCDMIKRWFTWFESTKSKGKTKEKGNAKWWTLEKKTQFGGVEAAIFEASNKY